MANHIEVLKVLREELADACKALEGSFNTLVHRRVEELATQVAALDATLVDAARFGDLREIIVKLNRPDASDALLDKIDAGVDQIIRRNPEPTPEAVNDLADMIIKTAREHANHS